MDKAIRAVDRLLREAGHEPIPVRHYKFYDRINDTLAGQQ